jgi:hypothetical protein
LQGEAHDRGDAEHRPFHDLPAGRIMGGDLEEQVELPPVAPAMLAKLRAHIDGPAANDLGAPHVVVPLRQPVLVGDVREGGLHR